MQVEVNDGTFCKGCTYGNVEILQTEYCYTNNLETYVCIRCIHYDMCKRAYGLDRDVQL